MRTIKGNMENCRQERQLDAEDRFAATIADDLRQLSVRGELLVKNTFRNTVLKYQMEIFNQRDHVGNVSLNKVAQCSSYTELLKSIPPAMTCISQHETAAERNYQSI